MPAGYKLTDLGVLPEEWEVKTLGKCAYVTKLAGFEYTLHFNSYKTPGSIIVIRGTNITNNRLDLSDIRTIPEATSKFLKRSKLNSGDLVFAYVGTIGPVYLVEKNNRFHLGPNTAKISPDAGLLPSFLLSYFKSSYLKAEITEHTSIGAQPSLSMTKIRSFNIPLPPLAEQQAIAEALGEMDALLAAQRARLAKQRAVKQGLLQGLLSGQQRLPGFAGEWEMKRLGNIAPLQRGFDLPNAQLKAGNYPVIYSNGVVNRHANYMVKGPGVTTGRSGTIGKVFFIEENYWPHNTSLWVTTFKGNDPRFIYHLYSHIGIDKFSSGSGVPTLNRNDVHDFELTIPSPDEQRAIAAVLSEADAYLAALEAEHAKTQLLKQGMMQNLLTGKLRLV